MPPRLSTANAVALALREYLFHALFGGGDDGIGMFGREDVHYGGVGVGGEAVVEGPGIEARFGCVSVERRSCDRGGAALDGAGSCVGRRSGMGGESRAWAGGSGSRGLPMCRVVGQGRRDALADRPSRLAGLSGSTARLLPVGRDALAGGVAGEGVEHGPHSVIPSGWCSGLLGLGRGASCDPRVGCARGPGMRPLISASIGRVTRWCDAGAGGARLLPVERRLPGLPMAQGRAGGMPVGFSGALDRGAGVARGLCSRARFSVPPFVARVFGGSCASAVRSLVMYRSDGRCLCFGAGALLIARLKGALVSPSAVAFAFVACGVGALRRAPCGCLRNAWGPPDVPRRIVVVPGDGVRCDSLLGRGRDGFTGVRGEISARFQPRRSQTREANVRAVPLAMCRSIRS